MITIYALFFCVGGLNPNVPNCQAFGKTSLMASESLAECQQWAKNYTHGAIPVDGRYYVNDRAWVMCLSKRVATWEETQ